jgi:hypothetical protein
MNTPFRVFILRPIRWRADYLKLYYLVMATGEIGADKERNGHTDDLRWACRNYFQTEKEAKESPIYKVFHLEEQ